MNARKPAPKPTTWNAVPAKLRRDIIHKLNNEADSRERWYRQHPVGNRELLPWATAYRLAALQLCVAAKPKRCDYESIDHTAKCITRCTLADAHEGPHVMKPARKRSVKR